MVEPTSSAFISNVKRVALRQWLALTIALLSLTAALGYQNGLMQLDLPLYDQFMRLGWKALLPLSLALFGFHASFDWIVLLETAVNLSHSAMLRPTHPGRALLLIHPCATFVHDWC